jgi:hypothetical protein
MAATAALRGGSTPPPAALAMPPRSARHGPRGQPRSHRRDAPSWLCRNSAARRLGARTSHASTRTSRSLDDVILLSRTSTAAYPLKCGVVKNTSGSLASNASFISRPSVRTPKIGPLGAFFPSAAISEDRNGRSQAKVFSCTAHAALPYEVRSLVPGKANASRRTSRQEAMRKAVRRQERDSRVSHAERCRKRYRPRIRRYRAACRCRSDRRTRALPCTGMPANMFRCCLS